MFPVRHRTLPIGGLAQLCTILKSVGDFLTVIASLRITARAAVGLACCVPVFPRVSLCLVFWSLSTCWYESVCSAWYCVPALCFLISSVDLALPSQ